MAIKNYYDSDCNLGVLDGKTVAVIGFGSQGSRTFREPRREAASMSSSACARVLLTGKRPLSSLQLIPTSRSWEVEEAAKAGDVVMMLVPDELCAGHLQQAGRSLHDRGQGSGFRTWLQHPLQDHHRSKNVDVIMIAPKGPGPHRPPPVHRGRGLPLSDLCRAGLHWQG